MLADIAGADGAQKRIGQRMQADIGIGMAFQPRVWGTPMPQSMILSPGRSDGRRSRCRSGYRWLAPALAGTDRSASVVTLKFSSAPAPRDREPGRLGHRGIVGQLAAGGGAMGGQDIAVAKGLGRLGPPQGLAVEGLRQSPSGPLDRVGDRQGGDGARRCCECRQHPVDQRRIDQGPAASWISTMPGACRAGFSRPAAHGFLARGAAGDGLQRRKPGCSRVVHGPILGWITTRPRRSPDV